MLMDSRAGEGKIVLRLLVEIASLALAKTHNEPNKDRKMYGLGSLVNLF